MHYLLLYGEEKNYGSLTHRDFVREHVDNKDSCGYEQDSAIFVESLPLNRGVF